MSKTYYQILDVDPNSAASEFNQVLTHAFEMIKPEINRELAKQAFDTLNNPQKRKQYDTLLKEYGHDQAVIELQKLKLSESIAASKIASSPHKNIAGNFSEKVGSLSILALLELPIVEQLSLLNQLTEESFSGLKWSLGIGQTVIGRLLSPTKELYHKHGKYLQLVSLIKIINVRKQLCITNYLDFDEATKMQAIFYLLNGHDSNFEKLIQTLSPKTLDRLVLDIINYNRIYNAYHLEHYKAIITSLLKQLNKNNRVKYLSMAQLFEDYSKSFILGLIYCEDTTRFAIILRHFSKLPHLGGLCNRITEDLDRISDIDTEGLYSDLELVMNLNNNRISAGWVSIFNQLKSRLALWLLNCSELERLDRFNLQFSSVNGVNNIAVLLNYLKAQRLMLSELIAYNSNFSLENIDKVILELQVINSNEIYVNKFSKLTPEYQKQFCLALIYSIASNTTKYHTSLKFQDKADLVILLTVLQTELKSYIEVHPQYEKQRIFLSDIVSKQIKDLEDFEDHSTDQLQMQDNSGVLNTRNQNVANITKALTKYLEWMNKNTNASFLFRLFCSGHIFHGKTGRIRAETALATIRRCDIRSERGYQQIKDIVKISYQGSGNHRHSLRRFMFAYLNNDIQNGFDQSRTVKLSDSEFKNHSNHNNILMKL